MREKYLKIFGIIIFIVILFKIDILLVLKILFEIKLVYILAAICLTAPVILAKAWRWKYLLSMQDVNYSLKSAFLSYLASTYLGVITPGRLGDFTKVLYLKYDKNVVPGRAFSSVIVDKIFDLLVLLFVGIVSLFTFPLSRNII